MSIRRPNPRSDSYDWLSTAYHEAGHAVAVLLLGRVLFAIEVTTPKTGVTWREGVSKKLAKAIDAANKHRCMSPELLLLWRDECFILDAGAVAEAEFNLVSENVLTSGARSDIALKAALIPELECATFVEGYYHRRMLPCQHLLTEACRALFRLARISALTRTLAEALLRARRMDGGEVMDTLLANRAYQTGQRDLFWKPMVDDPFARRQSAQPPVQFRLL